jgi:hypothetical protein
MAQGSESNPGDPGLKPATGGRHGSETTGLAIARIRTGVGAGVLAVMVYSTFFFVPWPAAPGVVVASLFGILLGVGCIGLREFLTVNRSSFTADLAAVFGVLAGLTVMLMLTVQLAVRQPPSPALEPTFDPALLVGMLDRIHFGLDVAWDMLIATATLLFSASAVGHPRYGWLYALPGAVIAVTLVVTNLLTFPLPPAGAGSFDVGPLVGGWYVAMAVRAGMSLAWARGQLSTPGE